MSSRPRLAGLLVPALLLAGCAGGNGETSLQTGAAAPDGPEATAAAAVLESTDACATVAGELIPARPETGEPMLEVPLPDGWQRDRQLDSDLVRLALTNPALTRDSFAPNLVVTAEPSPADVEQAIDLQLTGIADLVGPADLHPVRGEICGHPSATVEYTLPPMAAIPERPAVVQIIVVDHDPGTLTYTMTAQATAPADRAYERDVARMLEGVQISG